MRDFLKTTALAATVFLAACATPTPYVPAQSSDDFGYREQQVASGRWRVRFAANSVTSRETVENYLMFRAAELTLAQGRSWFVVTDRDIEPRTTYYGDGPAVSPSVHYGSGHHGGFGLGIGINSARPSTEYFAVMGIRMLDSKPADSQFDAFDARDVVGHLRDTLRRDTAKPSG